MTIDIRAQVICRIGTEEPEIISGGWSDDHAQGTGLIRTRGELIVRGLIRPTLGQQVDLAYIQHGIASRVPRALRVLGAFADPFRNQTTMQLGCALTLRENLAGVEPQDLTADTWNDPANANIVCSEFEQVPISISAAYVASVCAQKLGINVPGGFPLTNWFTVAQFDLSPGYATVLSDLLVSESYIGYLDAAENLQIQSLLNFTGTTTVIDPTQVIDVSAINSGDIPGNAVSASYSYNRFKNQEEELTEEQLELRDWEKDETVGPPSPIVIKYEGGTYSRTVTPVTTVITTYDDFDRVTKRVETTKTHVASTNPSYIKWFSEQGQSFTDTDDFIIKTTTFEYQYQADQLVEIPTPPPGSCSILYGTNKVFDPERDNKILSQTEETLQSEMALAGALAITEYSGTITTPLGGTTNWVYNPALETEIVAELVVTTYEQDPKTGITKTITTRQQAQAFTQSGQQVGAEEAQDALEDASVGDVVERGKALINLGTVVQTRTDRQFGLQRRPGRSARQANYQRKSQLESFSDIVFVTGNVTSGSITRYSVPYSSDDRITGLGGLSPSDAPVKAAAYARAQNQLAFGHRNGFSIQLAATDIPTYPLDRLMVSAADTAAAYVCNGTSWSFDSNGIVCNTDALFIGGVGTTETGGSLWFPVQPGITLLGPAPEVYQNVNPQPANSIEVGEEFDPLNPPPTFWDEDLPTDTPAIPTYETEIEELVPPWREEISNTFVARTTIDVSRTYPNIPTIQPVALVTKTAISVRAVPLRNVVIPVFTKISVEELGAAVRAEPVEMFTMFSFGAFVF
jgi:hypothetical protein